MKVVEKINWNELKYEYGLDGKRLLPWEGRVFPFGGAYCVVRPHSSSLEHVNEPLGEEELFICISGKALVHVDKDTFEASKGDVFYMPAGSNHYIENNTDEPFHLYALWWNDDILDDYKSFKTKAVTNV